MVFFLDQQALKFFFEREKGKQRTHEQPNQSTWSRSTARDGEIPLGLLPLAALTHKLRSPAR